MEAKDQAKQADAETTDETVRDSATAVVQDEDQITITTEPTEDPTGKLSHMDELRRAIEEGKEIEVPAEYVPEGDKSEPPTSDEDKAEEPKKAGKKPKETDEEAEPETEIEQLRRKLRERDGRYGSEKQQLTQRIEALERQLQETAKAEPQPEPKAAEAPAKIADPTDDDLKDAYGEDFEEFMGRDYAARLWKAQQKAMQQRENQILSKMEQIAAEKIGGAKATNAMEKAIEEVEREIPGARELDANAEVNGFAEYLNGDYSETGFTRREVADRAMSAIRNGATGADYSRHKATLVKLFRGFSQGGDGEGGEQGKSGTMEGKAGTKPRPDPSQHIMPNTSKADRAPTSGANMTVEQVRAAMKKAAEDGNLDKVMASVFNKAVRGEVVA